jgi:hypothetical protein
MHLENAIEYAKELALSYKMDLPYDAKLAFNRQNDYDPPEGQCLDFVYGEAEIFVQPIDGGHRVTVLRPVSVLRIGTENRLIQPEIKEEGQPYRAPQYVQENIEVALGDLFLDPGKGWKHSNPSFFIGKSPPNGHEGYKRCKAVSEVEICHIEIETEDDK